MNNRKIVRRAIIMALLTTSLSSCIHTRINMNPISGFKLAGDEHVIGWVTLEGEYNPYWTNKFCDELKNCGLELADYNQVQDLLYEHLLINNPTDSISLIKLGQLSSLDYLIIGAFEGSSQKQGRGIEVLTPHDQVYHEEDFERWRNFNIYIYNLSNGYRELFQSTRIISSGLGYEENLQTRFFFSSDYKLKKKAFKKSIKKICD